VGNSHESRRVEETSEGHQDSLWAVVLLLLLMMMTSLKEEETGSTTDEMDASIRLAGRSEQAKRPKPCT
jgi:hypothetical protein